MGEDKGGIAMTSSDLAITIMFAIAFSFLAFVIWIKER